MPFKASVLVVQDENVDEVTLYIDFSVEPDEIADDLSRVLTALAHGNYTDVVPGVTH